MTYYIASTTCQQWHSHDLPFYCVVSIFSSIKTFSQTNSCSRTTMSITCLRNIMPPFTFQLVYKMYQLQHPQFLIGIVWRNICGRNLSFWHLHLCIWGRNWYLLWFEYLYLSICGEDFYLLSLKDQTPVHVHFGVRLSYSVCVCACAVMYVFCIPFNNFIVFMANTTRQWQRCVRQHRVSLWRVLESRAVDSAFIPPSMLSCTQQNLDSGLWGSLILRAKGIW